MLQAVVDSFVQSPNLLEPKIYLLLEMEEQFTFNQIDAILESLEKRFSREDATGSQSFLLCNLNPIKTACHLLMILDQI